MDYAEAAYFDGNACQHVADWREAARIERKRGEARAALERRAGERRMRARVGSGRRAGDMA